MVRAIRLLFRFGPRDLFEGNLIPTVRWTAGVPIINLIDDRSIASKLELPQLGNLVRVHKAVH